MINLISPHVAEIAEELREINDPADYFADMAARLEEAVVHDYHDQHHNGAWKLGCEWCDTEKGETQ